MSEDAGFEPRTVATSALAVKRSNHSARSHPQLGALTESAHPGFSWLCTVKKVIVFPVPSRDVTNQTLSGREKFKNSRPGTVWLVTSRLGPGKTIIFIYSVSPCLLLSFFIIFCFYPVKSLSIIIHGVVFCEYLSCFLKFMRTSQAVLFCVRLFIRIFHGCFYFYLALYKMVTTWKNFTASLGY